MTQDGRDGDPHERLRALQRRVYAADGDAAGDAAVVRAMLELQAELAAEQPAVSDAVGPEPGRAADPADPAVGLAPDSSTDPATESAAGEPGPPPRRRVLLGAGLAGAVALGALLGGTVSMAIRPTPPAPTDAATAAAGEPVPAAQVFTRLQTAKDVPLVAMPEAFAATSFRYLGSAGWTDADGDGVTDSPYYAARSNSDMICLVVVPEGSGYLSTCAPESAYPSAGLRLSWQSTDLHPGVPDGTAGIVLDVTVAWRSDSTVETRGAGRPVSIP
ncbi:hypothetical protein BJQ94_15885 [Cryobacterium sp. SO2]|uniref:hypothetical protein n=1 Tax=Cryobacterium sp. SO2 TaxID=1897060 RepID=UPI00223DA771|nr:hypothetical protein [Cryobacterium sp. SO2]WEO76821.1 hypothetical protein BJQ94_15885 [Cryobacterium sp. SO2]